jgi:hypothetical protein
MTHTKDKTLLASLSFGDKDKKDRRHDLACQYLIQSEVAMKIVTAFRDPNLPGELTISKEVTFTGGSLEIPLTKGHNQYKTFIGFIDGSLSFESVESEYYSWSKSYHKRDYRIFFEVKINPETAGNVLRQLNLYREFMDSSVQLLVTAYDVSPLDQALFKENGIVCVRLGEAFDEFVRAQEAASKIRNENIATI